MTVKSAVRWFGPGDTFPGPATVPGEDPTNTMMRRSGTTITSDMVAHQHNSFITAVVPLDGTTMIHVMKDLGAPETTVVLARSEGKSGRLLAMIVAPQRIWPYRYTTHIPFGMLADPLIWNIKDPKDMLEEVVEYLTTQTEPRFVL